MEKFFKKKSDQVSNLCMHHKEIFLVSRHEYRFESCCDIYKSHRKKLKDTILITVEIAKKMERLQIFVKPGWRICVTCCKRFKIDSNCLDNSETSSNSSSETEHSGSGCDLKSTFDEERAKDTLYKTFQSIGVSPIESSHSQP